MFAIPNVINKLGKYGDIDELIFYTITSGVNTFFVFLKYCNVEM